MIDKNFKFNPIQEKAIERLRTVKQHVIALSPGSGKTMLILSFIEEIFKDNSDKCIFMIPKSARASFIKEMTTRIGDDFYLITVETAKKYSYSEMSKYRYIFIENTLVNKYIEDLVSLANTNTCHLVIDEAHSLQSPDSVFTKAAWEVRCYCKRVYAMTATPLLNDIEGLFNVLHFVYPAIFTSWFKFRARYCLTRENIIHMKSRNGNHIKRKVIEIIGYQNMKELNEILDKLIIKGCIHYNVNFEFLECDLDEQSEKPYNLAASGLFDILYHPEKVKHKTKSKNKNDNQESHFMDDQKDFGSRVHDLSRVVDGCDIGDNDPSFISNKMKLLLDQVKLVIDRNESMLIYFEYKDSLEMAERILLDHKDELGFNKIYRLTGAEKEDLRAKIESNLGLKEIVLCSQAASQSRNLQRANNICIWNCPWSIGKLIQVSGRICRTDSTYDHQNITVLSVKDTIDEYKVTLLKDHLSLINKLLGNEAMGAVEDCEYLDIDRANMKSLKNNLLWRRNKKK
jgi:SNF2 family DNA or RNA helicase